MCDKCSHTHTHTHTITILNYNYDALILKDPLFFVQAHKHIGNARENMTSLRLLHYPPLAQHTTIRPGQLRCGEHVDYGSVTLLFQDPIGGLQVRNIMYIEMMDT